MAFNFKQALEKSRTPVGKAEEFLEETLKVIKKMDSFSELSFSFSGFNGRNVPPYTIYSIAENGNILRLINQIQNYDEALSIFKAVERLLEKDYSIVLLQKPKTLSSFKITI